VSGKAWRDANPEKIKGYYDKHRRNNLVKFAEKQARRRARKKDGLSTLTLSERVELNLTYEAARMMTEMTGVQFHVDHIIPLAKGGKHHPTNLQHLTAEDNIKKGARLDYSTPQKTYPIINPSRPL
jgi:5-methylcytosine-specific restriction endonuclease McrA